MIVVEQNEDGFFDVTIFDKSSSIVGNFFDFKFQNEMTNESVELSLNDISIAPERYSRFEYTSTMFQNSTPGFWKYEIKNDNKLIAFGKMLLSAIPGSFVQYDGRDNSVFVYSK